MSRRDEVIAQVQNFKHQRQDQSGNQRLNRAWRAPEKRYCEHEARKPDVDVDSVLREMKQLHELQFVFLERRQAEAPSNLVRLSLNECRA